MDYGDQSSRQSSKFRNPFRKFDKYGSFATSILLVLTQVIILILCIAILGIMASAISWCSTNGVSVAHAFPAIVTVSGIIIILLFYFIFRLWDGTRGWKPMMFLNVLFVIAYVPLLYMLYPVMPGHCKDIDNIKAARDATSAAEFTTALESRNVTRGIFGSPEVWAHSSRANCQSATAVWVLLVIVSALLTLSTLCMLSLYRISKYGSFHGHGQSKGRQMEQGYDQGYEQGYN